ncbi:LOW QUALITY PROTEIN: galactoside alpha-(1,2)-fucosyltransferase 2-like [Haliotis rubra]|uniref:LOW QUALITY PROTEIN: galactoside alpha-(1,2)-fucosyltransferase 2-like n=1 Tax=Haliotis rubra TaxID=36100 RepID=UPI001EE55CB5|nr:LOW QUALITY PROTEIN: galactoside alpha-(1,2)-fucosyltransferase 2-like [Haliotis rubra]
MHSADFRVRAPVSGRMRILYAGRQARRNPAYAVGVFILLVFALMENQLRSESYSNIDTSEVRVLSVRDSRDRHMKVKVIHQDRDVKIPNLGKSRPSRSTDKTLRNGGHKILSNRLHNSSRKLRHRKNSWQEKPILTIRFDGRLGNQMFEYAAVYAIARKKKMKIFLTRNHQLNKIFHIDESVIVRKPCGGFTNVNTPCCGYDATTLDRIQNNTCQRIFGYFQSWRYFESLLGNVRRQFTFRRNIIQTADAKLWSVVNKHKKYPSKPQHVDAVSSRMRSQKQVRVHLLQYVRRGDLMLPIRVKQGRRAAPKQFYLRAMDYFRRLHHDALFIVGSDSQQWAAENLAGPDVIVLKDMLPEVDMCILSRCNHTVMSVGTFGWWVGLLGRGRTVYYNQPFIHTSETAAMYSGYEQDFIRPGWIGMS